MKVKQLIAVLKKMPQEASVYTWDIEGYLKIPTPFDTHAAKMDFGDMTVCKLDRKDIPKKRLVLL